MPFSCWIIILYWESYNVSAFAKNILNAVEPLEPPGFVQ